MNPEQGDQRSSAPGRRCPDSLVPPLYRNERFESQLRRLHGRPRRPDSKGRRIRNELRELLRQARSTPARTRVPEVLLTSRAAMRPAGKARRPRILGVFEGGATPLDGMQRGPNVTRLRYTVVTVRKSGRRCATAAEVRRTAQFLKAVVHRLAQSAAAAPSASSQCHCYRREWR